MKYLKMILLVIMVLNSSLSAQVEIAFGSVKPAKLGETVVVPITVKNFRRVDSFMSTIQWDAKILEFQGISDFRLENLNSNTINTSKAKSGIIYLSWDDPSGLGSNLPDGTNMFVIKFKPLVSVGMAEIAFTDTPIYREVTVDYSVTNFRFVNGKIIITPDSETIELSNIPASGVSSAPIMQASDAFSFTTGLQNSRLLSVDYYKIVGQKTIVLFSDNNGAPGSILAASDPLNNIYPTGYGNWNRQVYIFSVKPELKSYSKYWIRGAASGGEILCGGAPSNNEQGWQIGATGFRSAASDVTTIALFQVKAEIAPPAVVIVSHPTNITTDIGNDVSFSVTATNALTYQWFKDGNALPSATNAIISLTNSRPVLIGDYFAVASNVSGTATSSVASLSIKGVDSGIWKGLVAYYPFNGNANDESGNGNHLKKSGLPKYEKPNRNGNNNSSVDLSGGANYFTLDDTNFSNSIIKSQFTIVYWRKGDGSDSAVCVEDSASVLWAVGGKGDVIGADENVGLSGERVGFGFKTGLSGNQWNCVSIVWNGNSSKAYSNGKAIGYGYLPPPSAARDTHRLYIGADPYAGFEYYNGQLDDIRIYNRALSDGEVESLYNHESTPPNPVSITSHPANIKTDLAKDVSFSVTATNALTYQWFKDGNALPSATNSILSLTNARPVLIGDYFAVASNTYGTATSSVASFNIKGVDAGIWKGLVAYYPFNGNANDESGNGNHGKVNGAILENDKFGDPIRAYSFDGMNQSIEVEDSDALDIRQGQSLTISVSIKHNVKVNNSGKYIVSKYSGSLLTGAQYAVGTGVNANSYTTTQTAAGYANWIETRGDVNINDGSWHQLVYVWRSGLDAATYIDGVLDVSRNHALSGEIRNPLNLLIGCGANFQQFYSGVIDDIRIYNRALSDAEVKSLHLLESTPPVRIVTQPVGITVNLADSSLLSVGATNVTSYQWRKYGYDIVGATNSILTFTNVQPVDLGDYQVVVANSVSSLTSSVAKLLIKGVGDGVYQGMSFIPAGPFEMGDDGVFEPVQTVMVSAFAMDKWEVSLELWESVRRWGNAHGYDLGAVESFGAKHPVHYVNGYSMIKWNNARSEKEGIPPAYYEDSSMTLVYRVGNKVPLGVKWDSGYRLPTEAEWEKAARGGVAGKLYPWGTDEISPSLANYPDSKIGKTTPIGTYLANQYGLYDMAGNVEERCWRGPSSGDGSVTRGGGWYNYVVRCRVSYLKYGESFEGGNNYVGFRSVLPFSAVPNVLNDPLGISSVEGKNIALMGRFRGLELVYKWQKDGVDLVDGGRISGSGSQTLTISGATLTDAGQYRLRASNSNGSAVTEAATVTVWVPVSITAQPTSLEGLEGSSVQLLAAAAGFPVPTYQWFKGGTAITGATNAILEFPQFLEVDAGTYRVVASNVVGAVTSSEAVLSYRSALQVSFDGKPVTGMFRTLNPVQVELQFANKDWLMFYTLDGTDPDFASIPYVGPFTISDPANLRVAAYSPTFAESYVGKELLVRFLKPQIIDWGALPTIQFGDSATLNVLASSGLPVNVTFVSGPASWTGGTLKALGAGTVVLRATQSGDDVFAPLTVEKTLTIDPATQVLAWPTLADKQFGNSTFGVQVTAASGLPVGLKVVSGKAMVQGTNITLTGAGEVILSATQAGTANYKPITEQRSFTVAKAEQTLTMGSVANRGFSTQSFSPAAASSSGLPVAFSVLSGPAQVVAGGVQLTGVGAVVLRASQSGNDDYVAAVPVDRTFTVSKGDQTLTFDPVGSKTFNDAAVTLSARSSVGLPVTFRVISGPGTLSGTQLTFTGAGTLLLQVLQAGNENYNTAAASQTLVVGKAGQVITFPALPNLGYSTNVIPLKATTSSGLAVSYRVVQGVATVTSAGLVLSAVGNVSVAADQTGNTNYLAAASVTNSFIVSRGDQVITFVPVGDQVLGSAPVTLKATNSTGLPVLFQLLDGTATLSGAVLTLLGEGTVTLRAKQLGSPLYNAAQVDQTFVIRKLATLTVTQSRGGSVTVDPIKDNYAPTETVTLSVKLDPGFEFVGWTGGLTGNQNPAQLLMSANRTVAPQFKDVMAPSLTWNLPVAGDTGDERFTLSGVITDNLGATSATWYRDGGLPKALVLDSSGRFSVENEVLQVGSNTITLTTWDAAGNKTTQERVVVWVPQRILQIANAAEVQEGRRIVLPMTLSSDADNVAGLNFRVTYNPVFLTDPQLEWGSLVGQSVSSVNASIPGEVSGSFALAGIGLPTGTNLIATLNFRARSVPDATNVVVTPVIVGLGSPSGTLLTRGNATVAGQASIKPRRIKGDNNANQRVDIGDATVISRLQVGLEELRLWDRQLNDLNANGDLDNGDIIKALRTVVGLDPQPGPMGDAKRLSPVLPMERAPVSTNYFADLALLYGPTIKVGQPYRVAVRLKAGRGNLTGLSFSLRYPASLELKEKVIGAEIPADALPAWNVSGSRAKLAVIRPKAWVAQSGAVATFTFQPTPEAANQTKLPISLEEVEVSDAGEGLSSVPSVWLEIGGGLEFAPQLRVMRTSAEALSLEILGPKGLPLALESSEDLSAWSEIQQVTGLGTSTPVKVTLQADPNVQAKFWRVRVR